MMEASDRAAAEVFAFEARADCFCVSEPMPFACKFMIFDRDALRAQGLCNHDRLLFRHNLIICPLEKDQRRLYRVDVMDGRTLPIKRLMIV